MKVPRVRTLLLTVATVAAASLVLASPASAASSYLPIKNNGNGKCLQPVDVALGAAIVQEPCDGGFAQDWAFISTGGTTDRILNHATGYCLDARGGATNGTPIVQWTCGSLSNETWDTGRPLPDIVALTSRVSGSSSHCLDVPGAQAVDGLAMQLYGCNGTSAQTWLVGIGIVIQP